VKYFMLDDSAFLEQLQISELIAEYKKAKTQEIARIEDKYKTEREGLEKKKMIGVQQDHQHRLILNACIFPFCQPDSLEKYGYYFLRASPLSELGVDNVDFLLFRPDPETRIIVGEAKGSIEDPAPIVDQFKDRIKVVVDKKDYIKEKYLKNLDATPEYVLGVDWAVGNKTMKSVLRKGGNIKVWGAGAAIGSSKQSVVLITQAAEDGPVGKTMLHEDKELSKRIGAGLGTLSDYKSIFPESHTLAKLKLLTIIRESADGTFTFTQFFDLAKEELGYLEGKEVLAMAERILEVAKDIKFVEEVPRALETDIRRFKILSRKKKADMREEDLRRKWLDFAILKDKEQEQQKATEALQKKFLEKRKGYKAIEDYF
jgi:hypothetical protein